MVTKNYLQLVVLMADIIQNTLRPISFKRMQHARCHGYRVVDRSTDSPFNVGTILKHLNKFRPDKLCGSYFIITRTKI
jgi:hypothetical protein